MTKKNVSIVLPTAKDFLNLSVGDMDNLLLEVMNFPVPKDSLEAFNEKKALIKSLRTMIMDASKLEVGGMATPPQALTVLQTLAQSRGEDVKYFKGTKELAERAFKAMTPEDWNLGSKLYWVQTKSKFLNFVKDEVIQGTEPYVHIPWRAESGPTGQTAREPWNNLAVLAKIQKLLLEQGITANWEASPRKKTTANRTASEALAEDWLHVHVLKVFPEHNSVQARTWGNRNQGLGSGFGQRRPAAEPVSPGIDETVITGILAKFGIKPIETAPAAPASVQAPAPLPEVVAPAEPVFNIKTALGMLKAEGIPLPSGEVLMTWEDNKAVTDYAADYLEGEKKPFKEVFAILSRLAG